MSVKLQSSPGWTVKLAVQAQPAAQLSAEEAAQLSTTGHVKLAKHGWLRVTA